MSWCMVHLYIPTFVWFLMVSAGEYTIHGCYVTRFSDLMWLNDDTGDGHGILRLFVNDVYCLLCNQHLMYVGPFFFRFLYFRLFCILVPPKKNVSANDQRFRCHICWWCRVWSWQCWQVGLSLSGQSATGNTRPRKQKRLKKHRCRCSWIGSTSSQMVDFPAKYVILLESGWKKEHLQLQGFEFWMVFFPSERDSSGTFAAKWTDGLFLLSILLEVWGAVVFIVTPVCLWVSSHASRNIKIPVPTRKTHGERTNLHW